MSRMFEIQTCFIQALLFCVSNQRLKKKNSFCTFCGRCIASYDVIFMCLCFVVETENYLCKELFLLWVYSDSNENKSCKTKLVPKFLKFLLESFHALHTAAVNASLGEILNRDFPNLI